MCGGLLKTWLVLVVCTCGVAAAGEPNEPVAEPNKPWIVAEHLTAGWQSIALTTRHFNKDVPEHRMYSLVRSMSLAGRIEVIDPNGLIGLSEVAMDALAFDEAGKRIPTFRISQSAPSYKPLRDATTEWVPTGERIVSFMPYSSSIDMLMEPDAPFPFALSKVEWSMAALLSDTFKVVDVPFAVTGDWIELAPGLDVLVEQAVAGGGKYEYCTKTRYDPNRVQYLHVRKDVSRPRGLAEAGNEDYSWPDGVLPQIIVTEIDVIDVEGNSIRRGSEGMVAVGNNFDAGNPRIVTRTYSSRCPECADAAFIRHVLAFKPYNRQVQFVLENVPVPTE